MQGTRTRMSFAGAAIAATIVVPLVALSHFGARTLPVRVVAADLASGAQSVSEFAKIASLGIVATAVSAEEIPNAVDPTIVATKERFRVEQVLWGQANSQDVVVVYTGGVVRVGPGAPYRLQLEDQPPFVVGDRYVLGLIGPNADGNYMILGGPQGRYRVVNGALRTETLDSADPVIKRVQGLAVAAFAHAVIAAR